MISDTARKFLEEIDLAFVDSAEDRGRPHLVAGRGVRVPDPSRGFQFTGHGYSGRKCIPHGRG